MDYTIELLKQANSFRLENVHEDVFDHAIVTQSVQSFVADPRHHLAMAIVEDQVVGIASAIHYIHPDKPNELWVNEVGVAKPFRRRGVASALLTCLFDLAASIGCKEAWVATEIDNKAARGLYRSQNGIEEQVVMYNFPLKKAKK